jgi:hypothetical protein
MKLSANDVLVPIFISAEMKCRMKCSTMVEEEEQVDEVLHSLESVR